MFEVKFLVAKMSLLNPFTPTDLVWYVPDQGSDHTILDT